MTLNGDMQNRLELILETYRKTRPASLQSVLEEVVEAVRSGELATLIKRDMSETRYILQRN